MQLKSMHRVILVILLLVLNPVIASQEFIAGQDYTHLSNMLRFDPAVSQLLAKDPNRAQLLFFFSFGCPACARFDPTFEKWLSEERGLSFTVYRFPMSFEPEWKELAKLYYVMQDLKPKRDLNAEVFSAIHEQGLNLADKSSMQAFFVKHGYSTADFTKVYDSNTVQDQVKYADQISLAYAINSTPTIVVNTPTESYLVTMDNAGGNADRMLEITRYLIMQHGK